MMIKRAGGSRGTIALYFSLAFFSFAYLLTPAIGSERDYQVPWCADHFGELEVVLKDNTRVDCLTREYAVEVDFAHKWAEAIGQSLHYAEKAGRAPGIVLILKKPGDRHFVKILKETLKAWRLPVKVWVIR